MNNNNNVTHPELVSKLIKKPKEILMTLLGDMRRVELLHCTSKLCSEAGELMDNVGKHCYYNKELDVENVIEELGDMEFYMERIRQVLKISRAKTLKHNIAKLSKRYPDLIYSDQSAIERKDKV